MYLRVASSRSALRLFHRGNLGGHLFTYFSGRVLTFNDNGRINVSARNDNHPARGGSDMASTSHIAMCAMRMLSSRAIQG